MGEGNGRASLGLLVGLFKAALSGFLLEPSVAFGTFGIGSR